MTTSAIEISKENNGCYLVLISYARNEDSYRIKNNSKPIKNKIIPQRYFDWRAVSASFARWAMSGARGVVSWMVWGSVDDVIIVRRQGVGGIDNGKI